MNSLSMRPENREVTLDAWRARMQRVTDWLVQHLDQPFDLDRLAELAHFSPYHFHRVYTVVMGEPVAETVRRMRLHRAAVQLVTTACGADCEARGVWQRAGLWPRVSPDLWLAARAVSSTCESLACFGAAGRIGAVASGGFRAKSATRAH
jgi:AraC-like DNA-binding protein